MPIRKCVVCSKKEEKKNLLRIIRKEDKLLIDYQQKENARGAYLHKECAEEMLKKCKIWLRALKLEGNCWIKELEKIREELLN
ncbi:MAG: YlxR family protein [Candidatus Dadabacteria bacterium]|nr:MAG: YlxR family protein [Candidatus Dadabacteria bacterium]